MVKSTNSSTNTYVGEEMGPGGLLYLQLIAVDPPIQIQILVAYHYSSFYNNYISDFIKCTLFSTRVILPLGTNSQSKPAVYIYISSNR